MVEHIDQPAPQTPAIPSSALDILDRIPMEILCAIFYECIPAERNPVMSSKDAPILLTHVSKTWRSAAHQTPRLWTRLHIAAPMVSRHEIMVENLDDGIEAEDINRVNAVLEWRVQLARDWMSRTGDLSLSLSIFLVVFPSHASNTNQWLAMPIFDEIFNLIVQHAHHIQAFDFTGPFVGIIFADRQLSRAFFPRLSDVHLRLTENGHQGVPTWASSESKPGIPSSLLLAPNIKRLTFLNEAGPNIYLTFQACWTGLTHLIIHSEIHGRVVNMHLIFNLCPSLIVVQIYNVYNLVDSSKTSLRRFQPVELPSLKTLHLLESRFTSQSPGDEIGQVLDVVYAPSLEYLVYGCGGRPTDAHGLSFIHFLKRSSEIRTCFLELFGFRRADMTAALDQVSTTLTNLTVSGVHYRHCATEFSFSRNRKSDEVVEIFNGLDKVDIGDNILQRLPCLESITILCLPITNTDGDILDLVKERIRLWKSNQTSLIREFKIAFIRAQQRDILPEVRDFAAAAGAVVNMQLSYRRPRAGRRIPLSPSLGVDWESWDKGITNKMLG